MQVEELDIKKQETYRVTNLGNQVLEKLWVL